MTKSDRKSKAARVDVVDETIKGFLRSGISLTEFAAGLNNAFFHGKILADCGYDLDDEDKNLGELYKGIEQFSKAAKLF